MPPLSQLSKGDRRWVRGSSRFARRPARRDDERTSPSPNLVLVIVCAGVVLASLDLFIVNVALPQMSRSFGATGLDGLS